MASVRTYSVLKVKNKCSKKDEVKAERSDTYKNFPQMAANHSSQSEGVSTGNVRDCVNIGVNQTSI